MIDKWPTKFEDMDTAQQIMEEYAKMHNLEALGLFELVLNKNEKKMDFQLAPWVKKVARHFYKTYGEKKGDYITRQIISSCITKDETIH